MAPVAMLPSPLFPSSPMRTIRFFAAAALLLAPAALGAQTATGTVSANATVKTAVSFGTALQSLDFGPVVPGGADVVIAPANGGKIALSYNTSATVTVGTLSMTGPNGATISPTLACAQDASSAAAAPATFACGTGYTPALGATAATWHFYIGGTITGASTTTLPAGAYTGSVTLTATYTAL